MPKLTAPIRFMCLVLVLAVVLAFVLAPRRNERLAMLVDEANHAKVISFLEPIVAAGSGDPDILATLTRSYEATGNVHRAAEVLESYSQLRPQDGEALFKLADLYRDSRNVPGQVGALERAVTVLPTVPRIIDLADLYRGSDRQRDERRLLVRFDAKLSAINGQLLRLAELHVSVGDPAAAIGVLERLEAVAAKQPSLTNELARFRHLELLVDANRSSEAVAMGSRWLAQSPKPWLAERMLRLLATKGLPTDAIKLADVIVNLHPDIQLYLARSLRGAKARPVAVHLLKTWVGSNPSPTADELSGFVSVCRELDNPGIVWQAFRSVILEGRDGAVLIRFAETIAAEFGIGALSPYWSSLPRDALMRQPLLAARLAFHEQDLPLTRLLLDQVDVGGLNAANRRTWFDLLTIVASAPDVFSALQFWRRNTRLEPDLLLQYARLVGGLGYERDFASAIADLKRQSGQ